MNKGGFSPIVVLIVLATVLFGVFFVFRNQLNKLPSMTSSSESYESTSMSDTDKTALIDVSCENMQAVFKVPSDFVKYEETNSKGEQVCLLSNQIQEGHVSPTRVYLSVFATQKSSNNLFMSSRVAAQKDTQKYGGMIDLPEVVVKSGKFATYHVIAPDAFQNSATWNIDSISNDDTDTFYTITLSIPHELQGSVDTAAIMDGYTLSEDF